MTDLAMQIIIPSETEVIAAARQANAQHLHLLTNGNRTVLSPIGIPGWYKIAVKTKTASPA